MPTLAILGAGDLAGALAYTLARRGWPGEIRILDEAAPGVAAGKALDIVQAAPILGSDTKIVGSGEIDRAAGAEIVAIADRAGAGEWSSEAAVALLKRLAPFARHACIVCAGATALDLVETAVRELQMDRRRILGTAPAALESALRAMTGVELDIAPAEIALSLVGVPPQKTVVVWSGATVHGQPLTTLLAPPRLARLEARLAALWPPGPYALASSACRVCEALAFGSRRQYSCFVVPDGELGTRGRAVALPVGLRAGGIDRFISPALSVHEQVRYENAIGEEPGGRQRP